MFEILHFIAYNQGEDIFAIFFLLSFKPKQEIVTIFKWSCLQGGGEYNQDLIHHIHDGSAGVAGITCCGTAQGSILKPYSIIHSLILKFLFL